MYPKKMMTLIAFMAVVAFRTTTTHGQDGVTLFINEGGRIVLSTAEPVEAAGLDFQSPESKLVPVPDPPGTSQFTFLLANRPTQITFGNLGSTTTISGEFVTEAGYAGDTAAAVVDLLRDDGRGKTLSTWGNGPVPESFVNELVPSVLDVSLDKENRFQISGTGQSLTGFTLRSQSGSVVVPDVGAPFAAVTGNASELQYTSPTAVSLDGTLTLGAKWDDVVGGRDVRYLYELEGQARNGPFRIAANVYPPAIIWPRMAVDIDDDHHFVLTGSGHPLSEFRLHSRSGSLLPSDDAGPFVSVTGTPGNVSYASPNTALVLDGDLTLGTKWNDFVGGRDVRYEYDVAGQVPDEGPFSVDSAAYPSPTNWFRIVVSVNDEAKFVLRGDGQPLTGISLQSNSRSLIVSDNPGPFGSVRGDARLIEYIALENTSVILDGELTLDSGWERGVNNINVKDVRYNYDLAGDTIDYGSFFIERSNYPVDPVCTTGVNETLNVYIDIDNRFVLSAHGHGLSGLTLSSASGALLPGVSAEPFAAYGSNTNELVEFLAAAGAAVTINGTLVLATSWNPDIGTQDVQIDMGTVTLPDSSFPHCGLPEIPPDAGDLGGVHGGRGVQLWINGDGKIVLSANPPIEAAGLDFQSPAGRLIPVPDPPGTSQFTFLLANKPTQVTFGNLGSTTTISGDFVSEAGYDGTTATAVLDLLPNSSWGNGSTPASFVAGGGGGVVDPATGVDPIVPEPSSGLLLAFASFGLAALRRQSNGTCSRR